MEWSLQVGSWVLALRLRRLPVLVWPVNVHGTQWPRSSPMLDASCPTLHGTSA